MEQRVLVTRDIWVSTPCGFITPDPEAQAIDLQYKRDERAAMLSEAIVTGMRHATMSAVDRQSEMAYIDHAKASEKSLLATPLERRLLGMEDYLPPQDAELENLVDMDIPGLVAPGERSSDFVEAEVREQLSHLSRQKQDTIGGTLGTYEPTVFETREMPRLAPHRHWDLDTTEMEGARPQAAVPIQWHINICPS